MTTNKPEIVSWGSFYKGVMQDFGYNKEATKAVAKLDFHGRTLSIEPLIRLSDYEALQAECENLRKHLQSLIDQTTPLEPVQGNPMWSRRIQLDEVMAERDRLQAECAQLRAAIRRLCNIYVVDDYYDGQLRDERLEAAVNRAINAAKKEDNP